MVPSIRVLASPEAELKSTPKPTSTTQYGIAYFWAHVAHADIYNPSQHSSPPQAMYIHTRIFRFISEPSQVSGLQEQVTSSHQTDWVTSMSASFTWQTLLSAASVNAAKQAIAKKHMAGPYLTKYVRGRRCTNVSNFTTCVPRPQFRSYI